MKIKRKKFTVAEKVKHVKREASKPHGGHHCHWPGCSKAVPPAMWGCRLHWWALPRELRERIWQAFRPGQEQSKTPSRAYVEAAREVQAWIKQHYPNG